MNLNQTHDPARRSWVADANVPESDFPVQNLPFGIFRRESGETARGGVAIGNHIFDLQEALTAGLLTGDAASGGRAAAGETLDALLALPAGEVSSLRARLSQLLSVGGSDSDRARALGPRLLVPMNSAQMQLPVTIAGYTDFSCSRTHMSGMGGGKPVTAFYHVPIAYHGRASSIRVSGTDLTRPCGQWAATPPDRDIQFGPEPRLDFELELAAFVARGNALGTALTVDEAAADIFGFCLLNDWSARGIQFFESILGPFLGKSFLTTISPWIVTAEAMAPFHVAAPERSLDIPATPRHLDSPLNRREGGLDIDLTVLLQSAAMRARGVAPVPIVRSNFRHMFWTLAQMLAHHTSNGCNMVTGDLFASGTVSGPEPGAKACLVEITQLGKTPISLPGGEQRSWLEDGDILQIRGRAHREGYASIGFGTCDGRIVAARNPSGPG